MVSTNNRREIQVYANWKPLGQARLMGTLFSERIRGKEIFSFEYTKEWLKSGFAQTLDPDLQLYEGIQYLPREKSNFGLFLDSSPDRWGRLLMKRREAAYARIEKREETGLFETDYLLGVYDEHRMGAIRFKENDNGPFLNDDCSLASPPWTSLKELEEISLKLEEDDVVDDPEYIKWLNMLVQPGSSLGGARPKASILDAKNHLWIAKFPSKMDAINTGGWEMLANELAQKAGLNVAQGMAQKFSGSHDTFLTKRFDRTPKGGRIHFASAMTLLGYNDGDDFHEGVSYLELAEFIIRNGAKVNADLEELWRRIVFSIAISNTDDHLRNHGFLLTKKGWALSPAYDINPIAEGNGLKLNVSENDNSLDFKLVMDVIKYFRIKEKHALEIISHTKETVKSWQKVAKHLHLPRNEQELIKRAFSRVF
ncbi:MAG: HipA domain-containing protein [Bacteroidota bacterium]